jgi:hypothetical protein
MNRIIPKISSGNLKLLVAETICFNPLDGLLISVPTINETTKTLGNDLIFKFIFPFQKEIENGKIDTSIINGEINITIYNFGSSLLSGLTKPLTFKIGNNPISMFFTGLLLTNESEENKKLLQFTVSIYLGDAK